MALPQSCGSRNNVLRHFRPAHAPPAASNRALRRESAAVANATLRCTGDSDAAQRPGTVADLATRAAGMPVYMSGAFDLAPSAMSAIRDWLARQVSGSAPGPRPSPGRSGTRFVHARALWADVRDWDNRWPAERARFGAMLLITVKEEPMPSESGGGAAEHVIGSVVATEIEAFLRMNRPVGWLALEPGRFRFRSRFAVEGFRRIDLVRFAGVWPAVDAEPFRPAFSIFTTQWRGEPRLSAVAPD